MGCRFSIVPARQLLYEHFLPSFCLMKPTMTSSVVEICDASWGRILTGETEAYKEWLQNKTNTPRADQSDLRPQVYDMDQENNIGHNLQPSFAVPSVEAKRDGDTASSENRNYSPVVFFYDTFYFRLFVKAPELKPLFKQSLLVQGTMLVKVISTITQTLKENKSRALKKYLEDLARRHFDRGVHPEYYGVFVHCMMEAIEACLGEEFTQEVHKAWLNAFSLILRVMVPVAVDHLLTQDYEDGLPAAGSWGWSSTRDILKVESRYKSTSTMSLKSGQGKPPQFSKKSRDRTSKVGILEEKENEESEIGEMDEATARATKLNAEIRSRDASTKYKTSG